MSQGYSITGWEIAQERGYFPNLVDGSTHDWAPGQLQEPGPPDGKLENPESLFQILEVCELSPELGNDGESQEDDYYNVLESTRITFLYFTTPAFPALFCNRPDTSYSVLH